MPRCRKSEAMRSESTLMLSESSTARANRSKTKAQFGVAACNVEQGSSLPTFPERRCFCMPPRFSRPGLHSTSRPMQWPLDKSSFTSGIASSPEFATPGLAFNSRPRNSSLRRSKAVWSPSKESTRRRDEATFSGSCRQPVSSLDAMRFAFASRSSFSSASSASLTTSRQTFANSSGAQPAGAGTAPPSEEAKPKRSESLPATRRSPFRRARATNRHCTSGSSSQSR
mmetsp:Transcript_5062/g.10934  ORF Transcript_5062/g.10934 Transcript_5062/m.10934 type:complete len:227 (-) Transcript_5062:370-1050(-)